MNRLLVLKYQKELQYLPPSKKMRIANMINSESYQFKECDSKLQVLPPNSTTWSDLIDYIELN